MLLLPRLSVFLRGYERFGARARFGAKAGLALAIGTAGTLAHGASPPSIEDFASRPRVEGASISPDGRYLAVIQTLDGRGLVVVDDRQGGKDRVMHPVLGEPDHFQLTWCHWATNTRLLCGLRAITSERGHLFPVTRLVAVDADGKNMRVLMQNNREAQGQYQDEIINWHPGNPDTVLIEADEGLSANEMAGNVQIIGNVGTHGAPAVFELNVVTGQLNMRQHAREPIRHWVTDKRGQVRLGSGYSAGTVSFWVHLDGDSSWRRLDKFEVFSREKHFKPVAISAEDPDVAYAIGPSEGRAAIWLIDLKDKDDPRLLFSHPLVDVSHPILARDSRFIGARYDNGYPMMYYGDGDVDTVMRGFQKLYPGQFSSIVEASLDEKLFLVRSTSDIDASKLWLLNTETHQVSKIGAAYPDRVDLCLHAADLLCSARRHSHPGLSLDAAGSSRDAPAVDCYAARRTHCARQVGLLLPATVSSEPRICRSADEFSRFERLRRRLVFRGSPGLGRFDL
jgi:hypothetical protein